tara:strand:- start:5601 stop:5876 length:276 start_codon:yes stop_codon:yes gene_type:complete
VNRKQRREIQSLAKKAGNKDIEEKMKLFSRLGDKCRACDTSFNKTDINHLTEWMVIVRESENKVNLYCPPCWDQAKKSVEYLKKTITAEEK